MVMAVFRHSRGRWALVPGALLAGVEQTFIYRVTSGPCVKRESSQHAFPVQFGMDLHRIACCNNIVDLQISTLVG